MSDCLIIGGGAIGLLTALELHDAGLKVTLLERGQIGQESSWAGGGILSPLYPWRYPSAITALAKWSQAYYPKFIDELHQRSGIDPEWIRNGLLVLDTEEFPEAHAWAEEENVELYKISGRMLRDCEPELDGCYEEALWLPQIGQVRNPRLLKALRQALVNAGVTLLEYHDVYTLRQANNRIIGVETDKGLITHGCVVVATGAWSASLLQSVMTDIAITPVRGQMIAFTTQPGLISRIVLANNCYIIPRRDGHVLAGSTVEHVGFNKKTTESALQQLKHAAFSLIPRLTDYTVQRQWAGLRPGSPNGIPYIAKHPSIEGLYINVGHFRNGLVLGPGSARLLADILLERSPIVEPALYTLTAPRGEELS